MSILTTIAIVICVLVLGALALAVVGAIVTIISDGWSH